MSGQGGPEGRIETRSAGLALMASAVLAMFAMLHHPTGTHGQAPLIGALSLVNLVHAAMLILLGVQFWGYTVYSRWRGLGGWVLPAVLAYGVGFSANLIAGTVNGFVVPAVAARLDAATGHDFIVLLWQINQAFAQLGAYAMGLAILFWSLDLLMGGRRIVLAGAAGLVLAVMPALALLTGRIGMDLHGALLVYGAHMIWAAITGFVLMNRPR